MYDFPGEALKIAPVAPYLSSVPHPEGDLNDAFDTPESGAAIGERLGLTTPAKRKRRIRPWMWWVGGIVLVIALLITWSKLNAPKPVYEFQQTSKGVLTLSISATGTLAPRVSVDVGAEVSGRIDELYVDFNDHVVKGQKLAQINTDQIRALLDQYRATLQQQQATMIQAEAKLQRYTVLIRTHDVSQQDFDAAKGDFLRARAGVALAAAQVQQYESNLQKATIYAPIDGVVLDRKVSRGQTVAASFSTPVLFTLASDLRQMELDVDIDEADVGTIRAGQSAQFTVGAYPDRHFSARLVSVHNASQTVSNVVTYKGVLLVENTNQLLKPGMTATAEIVTGTLRDGTLVPNAALRFVPPAAQIAGLPPARVGAGLGRVWTIENGKLKPHDLKLGGTDGHSTLVLQGDIQPGQQVITDSKTAGQ
jgi:HlyD family secretion protein